MVASSAPSTSVKYGLGGSLQVSGFSCFTKGAVSTTRNNELEGSTLALNYTMDDGSNLAFQASVATAQARQLNVSGIQVTGGQCAGTYSSFLSPLGLQRYPAAASVPADQNVRCSRTDTTGAPAHSYHCVRYALHPLQGHERCARKSPS